MAEAQAEAERQLRRVDPLRAEVDELMARLDEVLREKSALEEMRAALELEVERLRQARSAPVDSDSVATNPPPAQSRGGLDARDLRLAHEILDSLATLESDAAARRAEGLAGLRAVLGHASPGSQGSHSSHASLAALGAAASGADPGHVAPSRGPSIEPSAPLPAKPAVHAADRFEFSGPLVLDIEP